MANEYKRLFLEDVEELDKNDVPQDLQIPILTRRYIELFDYNELLSLCTQIRHLDSRVPREIISTIWKEKLEYELISVSPDQLVELSIDEDYVIYLSLLLRDYEFDKEVLFDIAGLCSLHNDGAHESLAIEVIPRITKRPVLEDLLLPFTRAGMVKVVELLVSKIDSDSHLEDALLECIRHGKYDLAAIILDKISNDYYLIEPLVQAIRRGSTDMALMILDKTNEGSYMDLPMMKEAIQQGMEEVVFAILDKVDDNPTLSTYLWFSIQGRMTNLASKIIEKMTDVYYLTDQLERANRFGIQEIASLIRDRIKEIRDIQP